MRGVLLILAAALAASSAATAQSGDGSFSHHRGFSHHSGFSSQFASPGVRIHRGGHDRDGDFRRDRDFEGRDFRGDLYFPYRDYQGDTLWRPGSFNDWWHDRPDRAFPRWVATNQNCQRLWWSGGGWRC